MRTIYLTIILVFGVALLSAANITIFEEDFEGTFPGEHTQLSGEPTWDDNNHTSKSGSWSAWCSGSDFDDMDEYYGYFEDDDSGYHYRDEMEAKMVFGPFNLRGYTSATLSFSSLVSTEEDYDYLIVNVIRNLEENQEENPVHRETGLGDELWTDHSISLNEYIGNTPIYISFEFYSDGSDHDYLGAWIDDVRLVGSR